jgi:hypothetical protein
MGTRPLNIPATTVQTEVISLRGGLDQLTPSLSLKPGYLRVAENVECLEDGGYGRIKGYERFDGRPAPSDATYGVLTVTITGTLAVGNTITGATSLATGKLIYIGTDPGGATIVIYTRATGVGFFDAETLNVGGSPQATVAEIYGDDGTQDFDVRMRALAANEYRASISAVPGSGETRGVVYFGGICYAFRNNVGGTALACYKESGTGWVLVPMLKTISFTLGTAVYLDGGTLTRGGASATIKRVCLESGDWLAGTAAGKLVIDAVTGGPFTAGVAAGTGACTLSGAETTISLLPGGDVEFDIGVVGTQRRVYFADGVNRAWEFDGVTIAPIYNSGNSPDTPSRVLVHSGHLLLTYRSSLQCSGIGNPFAYTALLGAAEYQASDDITAMKRMQGAQETAVAALFTDAGMAILYGSSAADFRLRGFDDAAGAKPKTAQFIGGGLFTQDDRGIMSARASQEFGNFSTAALMPNARRFLKTRRNTAKGSVINREKSQMRVFFSDGYGLYVTMSGTKLAGITTVKFPDPVTCCCTGDAPDGTEFSFFGGADGFVYKLDAGTSFDGEPIEWELLTNISTARSPLVEKRWRRLQIEAQGDSYCKFYVTAEFAYSSTDRAQGDLAQDAIYPLTAGRWDSGVLWDAGLVWDGRDLAPSTVPIDGTGENIRFRIFGRSDAYDTFTINTLIATYSPRKVLRQ